MVTGTNLNGATAFNFGAAPGSSLLCPTTGTTCQASAPGLPVGAITNVTLTTPGGTTNGLQFTFTSAAASTPTITSVNPQSGTPGTLVTVTGTNLNGVVAFNFNGTSGLGLVCAPNGTSCQASAPGLPAGTTASVALTTSGGTTNALPFTFTSTSAPATGGFPVSYSAGWNLVAGPAGTIVTGNSGPLYTWQAGDTQYEVVPTGGQLRAGPGYWAFFNAAATGSLPIVGPQTQTVALPGNQYVMIGNPGNAPATVTGADVVYTYNSASTSGNPYTATTTLQPGQGAWAISINGGTASIASP